MKKKIMIIGAILVLAIVGVVVFLMIRDNSKDKDDEEVVEYKLLENSNITYNYVTSYKDYQKLMKEEEISKSDYYETISKEDFENQDYLIIIMPYDPCSENIVKENMRLDGDTYKVYLDVEYECGLCAPSKKVLSYKVDKIDLDVKIYATEVSREHCDPDVSYKPMIYIYPEKDMDLIVNLGNPNNLLYTYPKYNGEWNVHVTNDGNIYDYNTKRNYYGLYWEGIDDYKLDMSKGFVVKGNDTVPFLEEKLAILGLNDYEINEFIVYWIDKLESNEYNFISFRNIEDIEKSMPLYISAKPDTLIRVMMDYKPLNKYIEVEEQQLEKVERKGFTVVEWGGTKHN